MRRYLLDSGIANEYLRRALGLNLYMNGSSEDNGTAIGAALAAYHALTGRRVPEPVTDHFGSARISLYARRLEGTATTTDQCAADVLFLEDREERPPLKHIARRSYIPTILSILNATLGTRDRHGLPGRSTT